MYDLYLNRLRIKLANNTQVGLIKDLILFYVQLLIFCAIYNFIYGYYNYFS